MKANKKHYPNEVNDVLSLVRDAISKGKPVMLASDLPDVPARMMDADDINADMIDLLSKSTYSRDLVCSGVSEGIDMLPSARRAFIGCGIKSPVIHNFDIDDLSLGQRYTCQIIMDYEIVDYIDRGMEITPTPDRIEQLRPLLSIRWYYESEHVCKAEIFRSETDVTEAMIMRWIGKDATRFRAVSFQRSQESGGYRHVLPFSDSMEEAKKVVEDYALTCLAGMLSR